MFIIIKFDSNKSKLTETRHPEHVDQLKVDYWQLIFLLQDVIDEQATLATWSIDSFGRQILFLAQYPVQKDILDKY